MRGDQVVWTPNGMHGTVVATMHGWVQVEWEEGYPSFLSGATYWHQPLAVTLGLIQPEHEDLFEIAFQMAMEL